MSERPKVLGVIGARSGSKGIVDKNIRPLLDKPLMAWIIEAAKRSDLVDRVVLSTDSESYAEVGRGFGAETPFIRPAEFAVDSAPDTDFLVHTTKWLEENEGWKADIILRLPPTSPLCQTQTIDACIKLLLEDPTASSSRAITKAPKHPGKLWRVEGEELLPYLPKETFGFDEPSNVARQLLKPEAFAHVDVIAVRYDTLMKNPPLLTGERVRFVELSKLDAVDIDDELDFIKAEILLKRRLGLS